MPILPLSHPEPFAAVLGVMLHPERKIKRRLKRLPFSISVFHLRSSIDEEESYRVPT